MATSVSPYFLKMSEPIFRGSTSTREIDITDRAEVYRRSIRRMGGFWRGSFEYTGSRRELESFFYSRLGFNVNEYAAGRITWQGFIYEMDLDIAGTKIRRSIDIIGNRNRAVYTDHKDEVVTGDWIEEIGSQRNYGIKEETLFLESQTPDAAAAQLKRFTAEYAYPYPRTIGTIPFKRESVLTVELAGYIFSANFRFLSVASELDQEVGNLSYTDESGAETFTDDGQAFGAWATTSGSAVYSIWVTNDDDTVSFGYLGATVSATEIRVYEDQDLTTPGWSPDGDDPTGLTPVAYVIRGPASLWIQDILGTNCDYVTEGGVQQNLTQVRRDVNVPHVRAWEQMEEVANMGDSSGNIWALQCDVDQKINYFQFPITPAYFYREGKVYYTIYGKAPVNPYLVRPGVARNVSYLPASVEPGSAFADHRDFIIEEVEVGARSGLTLKTGEYEESELMSARQEYLQWLEDPLDRPDPEDK